MTNRFNQSFISRVAILYYREIVIIEKSFEFHTIVRVLLAAPGDGRSKRAPLRLYELYLISILDYRNNDCLTTSIKRLLQTFSRTLQVIFEAPRSVMN